MKKKIVYSKLKSTFYEKSVQVFQTRLFEVQPENKINDDNIRPSIIECATQFDEYLEPKMTRLRFKNTLSNLTSIFHSKFRLNFQHQTIYELT